MEYQYKEVYFDQYCKTCKHKDVAEEKDPIHISLSCMKKNKGAIL